MITLSELLSGICNTVAEVTVSGLAIDSRQVKPGDLFCAYPGGYHDGRDYVSAAIKAGAVAIAYEPEEFVLDQKNLPVPAIPVSGLREHLGTIAASFYGHPGEALTIIGVTGTNGKTSCVHLLAQALQHLGCRCAVIGTLGAGFIESLQTSAHTTPDAVTVQRFLRELLDQGATHVAMEVSSHALDQGRVNGVAFDVAVFTNLSHDHLDYHGDLETYGASKARLFTMPSLDTAVVNGDDPFAAQLLRITTAKKICTFGQDAGDVTVTQVRTGTTGLDVDLMTSQGQISLVTGLLGRINVGNLAAVASALLALGQSTTAITTAVNAVRPVPGRMELFAGGTQLPHVVVDYAHTPDALELALRSLRDHCSGNLWCLFGCGGDRDRAKRPAMGAIARRLADHVVVTNDNPRTEDPRVIAAEIVAGMTARPIVISDRARAIDWSINLALPRDWVLIAGKGHETTQQIGGRQLPHDDRDVVQDVLGKAA